MESKKTHLLKVQVRTRTGDLHTCLAEPGASLREVLMGSKLSPYRPANRNLNCHGLGICGTCRVRVKEEGVFWTRRACQIRCFHDLETELE